MKQNIAGSLDGTTQRYLTILQGEFWKKFVGSRMPTFIYDEVNISILND
jgi:hypothetical protein